MEKIQLSKSLSLSRIVHGLWRLSDWNLSQTEIQNLIETCVEKGITSFDHADIYGDYSCEKIFGDAFQKSSIARNKVQLISKCGIKLLSEKNKNVQIKHYDYSYDHIIKSAENSLKNLNTEYLDLLLLHRPSPLIDPQEVARAFQNLKESGKVLHFGVSNFSPQQYQTLNSYLTDKLITNQVEISPLCLEHFNNENIDFFLEKRIAPMAWSPLAGGKIFNPKTTTEKRVNHCLKTVAKDLNINSIDKIAYAWLLKHPVKIIPVIGSGKIAHIQNAIEALDIELSTQQWFKIYTATVGKEVP